MRIVGQVFRSVAYGLCWIMLYYITVACSLYGGPRNYDNGIGCMRALSAREVPVNMLKNL